MNNKKNSLCFKTRALGELKILANINEYALIEKQYDTPEKYIVAANFDIKNKNWDFGMYHTTFENAFEQFSNRVYTRTSEKTKLHNALALIEERFEPNDNEKDFNELLENTLRLTEEDINDYNEYSIEKQFEEEKQFDEEKYFENEKDVTHEKAQLLPDGWEWTHYYDGSGHLESPEKKSYFGYDLCTEEYISPTDEQWKFMDNYLGKSQLKGFQQFAENWIKEKVLNKEKSISEEVIEETDDMEM